jgi:two-component SAPR family response regulator
MLQQVQEVGILVSDVIMPGEIDGTTLATRVRSLRPNVGILLISGSEYLSSKPREFKFLGKPFTKDELGGALTELMT